MTTCYERTRAESKTEGAPDEIESGRMDALEITLDAAAGSSVGGKWAIAKYVAESKRSAIKRERPMPRLMERAARQAFMFGNGRRVGGLYRMGLPMITPKGKSIATNFVGAKGELSILMGKKTMVDMRAVIDGFGRSASP